MRVQAAALPHAQRAALGQGHKLIASDKDLIVHNGRCIHRSAYRYRFHGLVNVYGTSIKEWIHVAFGDGIMSAIGISMKRP